MELHLSDGSRVTAWLLRRVAVDAPVVKWDEFEPTDFEYDFERDKLAAHGVTFEEAVETFFSDFVRSAGTSAIEIDISSRTHSCRACAKDRLSVEAGRRRKTGWPL